jgi:sortase A
MKINKKHKLGITLIVLGLLLLAAASGLMIYNKYDSDRAAKSSREAVAALEEIIYAPKPSPLPSEPEKSENRDPESESKLNSESPTLETPVPEMASKQLEGKAYAGVLEIPDLGLILPILFDYNYEDLRKSPCIYTGSLYTGDLVICAHNYDSHFGRLKDLSEGAVVKFTDVNGQEWNYEVLLVEQLAPTAIEKMVTKGDWDLSLFTCTKGGQARVTVRCKKK